MNSPYFIECKTPGKPWQRIDCLPVATEEEAWDKMAAWKSIAPLNVGDGFAPCLPEPLAPVFSGWGFFVSAA